jgi:hypothetical protein
VRILASGDAALQERMTRFQTDLAESARAKGKNVREGVRRRAGF